MLQKPINQENFDPSFNKTFIQRQGSNIVLYICVYIVMTMSKRKESLPLEQDCQHKQSYTEDCSLEHHHLTCLSRLLQERVMIVRPMMTILQSKALNSDIYIKSRICKFGIESKLT